MLPSDSGTFWNHMKQYAHLFYCITKYRGYPDLVSIQWFFFSIVLCPSHGVFCEIRLPCVCQPLDFGRNLAILECIWMLHTVWDGTFTEWWPKMWVMQLLSDAVVLVHHGSSFPDWIMIYIPFLMMTSSTNSHMPGPFLQMRDSSQRWKLFRMLRMSCCWLLSCLHQEFIISSAKFMRLSLWVPIYLSQVSQLTIVSRSELSCIVS